MMIQKKSLIKDTLTRDASSHAQEAGDKGSKKPEARVAQPAKAASGKKLAVAKLATAKLTTAKMMVLRKLS